MAQDKVTVPVETPYDDSGLKAAQKDLKQVAKDAKDAGDASTQAGDQGATGFGKMAKYAAIATTAIVAVKKTVDFLLSSVRAAAEHARAVNTLSAAFKDVGYTAQGALKQAQDFATKMQNLTGIADEAFLDAQRLLANYGVVGAKAQEAIQAAYALSIGRSMDFASAVDLVTKAAAGQTQALARVGITLGDNVDPAEKFDKVLGQINDKFGATAKAAMGDYITQVNALKESWGDFKEQIGKYVIPALLEVIKIGQKAVNVLNNVLGHSDSILEKSIKKQEEDIRKLNVVISQYEAQAKSFFGGNKKAIAETLDKLKAQREQQLAVLQDLKNQVEARKKNAEVEKQAAEVQAAAIEKTRIAQIKKNEAKQKTIDLLEKEQKAEKDLREEQERKLNAIGLSTGKDLRGWDKGEGTSAPAPSGAEIFAGQNSQLGSAVDEVAQYDAEAERLENLYQLKKEYIDKEITDAALKEEAIANLQSQYDAQQSANLTKQAKARQQIMGSMWSALSSLATSENKKVAAVGKIAGVAQATISTFTGAAKALELPFPYNLAAMATVLAQGFALVGQIQSIKLAEGGLVKAVTGGIPAVIGEGGSDEAVLPLDDTKAMRRIGGAIAEESGAVGGGGVVVNINVAASGGVEAILEQLTEASRNGVVQALEFANLNYKVGASQQGYSV